MKGIIAFLFVVLVLASGCSEKPDKVMKDKGYEVFTVMRSLMYADDPRILGKIDPQKIVGDKNAESRMILASWAKLRSQGINPKPDTADQLLGVIVEIAEYQKEADNTVYMAISGYKDGDTRFFTSLGGGNIGEKWSTEMRDAVRVFVNSAEKFVLKAAIEKEHPLPKSGKIRFVFLTPAGARSLTFPHKFIADGGNDLYEVYEACFGNVLRLHNEIRKK